MVATFDSFGPISRQIWEMKYRLRTADGTPVDQTVEDTFARVARAAASAERRDRKAWAGRFAGLVSDFEFVPGGRILAGAGTKRSVTLFNCFVMGRIEDDLGSIFANLREAALTLQQGGGIGQDFSTLRPRGALVRSISADASGPVSFMDVWDAMCRTIQSAGARRGAMMATLACDHPDIEEFIDAKSKEGRLTNFNLSVLVSDAFIRAVRDDGPWDLAFAGKIYRTVRARALWDRIMRATYEYAEPGVIFIDRVNRLNTLNYCENISSTNPCGEQPLPPYGACLLGSINLARLVREPFEASAHVDETRLEALAQGAVRFLDNVIDISRYPLLQQQQEARAKRRIGLGVTGLADALAMCGVRYGSAEAAALAGRWMAAIERNGLLASAALAREKGTFPLYDRQAVLQAPVLERQPVEVRQAVERHGLRNGLVTSVAPTGTISLFAGNVSSGVEPIFELTYKRRLLARDGSASEETVEDYAHRLFRRLKGDGAPLPPAFVTAAQLSPGQHLAMQAALQGHVDSSISKTINCPADLPFEAFSRIYLEAYDLGLKGCTTYRPSAIRGSVLRPAEAPPAAGRGDAVASDVTAGSAAPGAGEVAVSGRDTAPPARRGRQPPAGTDHDAAIVPQATPASRSGSAEVVYMAPPLERDQVLTGATYKLRWPGSDHALYITINDIVRDGHRRPFEIFINTRHLDHYAWVVALTRMISAVFRRGGDVSFVVDELKAIFDPRGGQWMDGRYVPSLIAAIGETIERHLIATGFLQVPSVGAGGPLSGNAAADRRDEVPAPALPPPSSAPPPPAPTASGRVAPAPVRMTGSDRHCPRCGRGRLQHQEGCWVCTSCGYSKCG